MQWRHRRKTKKKQKQNNKFFGYGSIKTHAKNKMDRWGIKLTIIKNKAMNKDQ